MIRRQLNRLGVIAVALTGVLTAAAAQADHVSTSYGFTQFTSNGTSGAAGGLSLAVRNFDWEDNLLGTSLSGNVLVSFLFSNSNALATSITGIYFEDGAVLGIADITQYLDLDFNEPGTGAGKGTAFVQDGVPQNVPSGNTIGFAATNSHRVNASGNFEGVNGGEWVEIIFELQSGLGYSDVLAAIAQGQIKTGGGTPTGPALRFAMHVQGLGSDAEGSEGFINSIPLPAPFGLALAGLAGVVIISRRKRKVSDPSLD